MNKKKCILLLDENEFLANAAEDFCRALFDIVYVARSDRKTKVLPKEIEEITQNKDIHYLFNFLSPVYISESILNDIKIYSINFHPGPPDYPGVGSASFALFNNDKIYGTTAHLINQEYDNGSIIKTLSFPILDGDYCDTLFDRALNHCLFLFYDLLVELSDSNNLSLSGEKWERKATSRESFVKWMTLSIEENEDVIERKIHATKHSRLSGPYFEIFGEQFELPPRKK